MTRRDRILNLIRGGMDTKAIAALLYEEGERHVYRSGHIDPYKNSNLRHFEELVRHYRRGFKVRFAA